MVIYSRIPAESCAKNPKFGFLASQELIPPVDGCITGSPLAVLGNSSSEESDLRICFLGFRERQGSKTAARFERFEGRGSLEKFWRREVNCIPSPTALTLLSLIHPGFGCSPFYKVGFSYFVQVIFRTNFLKQTRLRSFSIDNPVDLVEGIHLVNFKQLPTAARILMDFE